MCVSSQNYKIALFRSLFKGREDVFHKRFESAKTGKKGYQPCCRNEWIRSICREGDFKGTALKSKVVIDRKDIMSAEGQNRTADTRIFSPLLYRLSYLGLNKKSIIFKNLILIKN